MLALCSTALRQFAQFVFSLAPRGHFALQLRVDMSDLGDALVHQRFQARAVLFQRCNQARVLDGHSGLRGEQLQRGHIVVVEGRAVAPVLHFQHAGAVLLVVQGHGQE